MHGILTWVVFVLFNIYMLTSAAGGILNAAGGVLGSTLSLVGQGAVAASPSLSGKVEQEIGQQNMDSAAMQGRLNDLKAKAPEAETKARQVGDDVTKALSKAGIFSFLGLLLGAAIAGFAANMGRRTEEQVTMRREPAMA